MRTTTCSGIVAHGLLSRHLGRKSRHIRCHHVTIVVPRAYSTLLRCTYTQDQLLLPPAVIFPGIACSSSNLLPSSSPSSSCSSTFAKKAYSSSARSPQDTVHQGPQDESSYLRQMRGLIAGVTATSEPLHKLTEVRNTSPDYRLSPEEFDLKRQFKDESKAWPRRMGQDCREGVLSLFNGLLQLDPQGEHVAEAMVMAVFCIVAGGKPPIKVDKCLNILAASSGAIASPESLRAALQLIINGLRRHGDYDQAVHLVKVWLESPAWRGIPNLQVPLLDASIFLLRSPHFSQRLLARSFIETICQNSPLFLTGLHSRVLAGLVAGFSRAAVGWADQPLVATFAQELEQRLNSLDPGTILGDEAGFSWSALAIWRALSLRQPSTDGITAGNDLSDWVKSLNSRGVLQDETTRSVIHSIVLRSRSEQLDACETEDQVVKLISTVSQDCGGVPPARSSWGWGIRSLLGQKSTLIRECSDLPETAQSGISSIGKPSNSDLDLIRIHEADLLLDTILALPRSPTPTPFLTLPHLKALLSQFPPHVDRAMSIYRLMRSGSKRSRKFARFFIFDHGQKDSNPPATRLPAPRPDRETITLLLDKLFSCDPVELSYAQETIGNLMKDQEELVLSRSDRVKYASQLLQALHDNSQDPSEAWEALLDSGTWTSDWQVKQWQELVGRLTGRRSNDGNGLSSSALRSLGVSPNLLSEIVRHAASKDASFSKIFLTGLLHQLGWAASEAARNDARTLLDLIRDLHAAIIRDDRFVPDLPLVNALMNAYNHCAAPALVHEVWEGLALVSLSTTRISESQNVELHPKTVEHVSNGSPTSSSNFLAIDGATLSIYLDACGRFSGGEPKGRQAWAFAGRLDTRLLARAMDKTEDVLPIRNKNAWDSWLEFLCRTDHMEEAILELEKMLLELAPRRSSSTCSGPDVKTVAMLLKFAARARNAALQKQKKGFFHSTTFAEMNHWSRLRNLIRSHDGLKHLWHQVKDIFPLELQ